MGRGCRPRWKAEEDGRQKEGGEVTDTQLYLSIGIPMLFNAGLIGVLVAYINSLSTRLHRVEDKLDNLVGAVNELDKRLIKVEIKLGVQP
jgi:hypothetical protein